MEIRLHPAARTDLLDAADWYATQAGNGVASAFVREFEHALSLVLSNPELSVPVTASVRKVRFRHFPYSLVYRLAGELLRDSRYRPPAPPPGVLGPAALKFSNSALSDQSDLRSHVLFGVSGNVLAVEKYSVVAEAARHGDIRFSLNGQSVEQLECLCIAEFAPVLEHIEASGGHLSARSGAVVLEHVRQRFPQQGEIILGKPGLVGQMGGDETVGAIETVGNGELPPHGAIVALLLLGLFLGRHSHAGDRSARVRR